MTDELRPCPFCGGQLILFGHDAELVNGSTSIYALYQHPELSEDRIRCPLTRLVFREANWNKRPLEDELKAELETLRYVKDKDIEFQAETISRQRKDIILMLKIPSTLNEQNF